MFKHILTNYRTFIQGRLSLSVKPVSTLKFLSPKLKTVYRYETQFCNPSFTNGVWQFRGFQYFCYEIWIYLVSSCSLLLNQNLHKCKQETREFRSTILLNFGLWGSRGNPGNSFTDFMFRWRSCECVVINSIGLSETIMFAENVSNCQMFKISYNLKKDNFKTVLKKKSTIRHKFLQLFENFEKSHDYG